MEKSMIPGLKQPTRILTLRDQGPCDSLRLSVPTAAEQNRCGQNEMADFPQGEQKK
jgi:hypothetical protein